MADVYILANKPRGTLYVGVTNDLVRRVYQHEGGGSTRRYGLKQLVYLAKYDTSALAMQREKVISINPGSGSSISSIFQIRSGARSLQRYHALRALMDARVKPAHDAWRACPDRVRRSSPSEFAPHPALNRHASFARSRNGKLPDARLSDRHRALTPFRGPDIGRYYAALPALGSSMKRREFILALGGAAVLLSRRHCSPAPAR